MNIPEKDFFTISEILERWSYSNIDDPTLLKYATDDLLTFSVYIRDIGSHQSIREVPEGNITKTVSVDLIFRAEGYSHSPLKYLKADDARRILESWPGERIAVRGYYNSPARKKESGVGFAQAPLFSRSDLLISRLERDRFEQTHKIKIIPPLPLRIWAWLADQANQRVLTMLSGWLIAAITGAWSILH